MGTDKALLPCEDRPLWKRQWTLLQELRVQEIFLSARPEQTWVPDHVLVLHDEIADAGPLAGIAAALSRATTTHLIVLAVDLPRMDAAWFQTLRQVCAPGTGAVGQREGFFEPLAAIYPCALRDQAEQALQSEERSLQRFIARAGSAMRTIPIDEERAGWFANWNEPGDA